MMTGIAVFGIPDFFSRLRIAFSEIKSTFFKGKEAESLEADYCSLINRNEGLIMSICYEYSNSKEDLEDLVQNVKINIWKGLKNYRNESKVETWIYRVTLNTCISSLRGRQTSKERFNFYENIESSEQESQRFENIQYMHSILKTLNIEERAIIILWLEERSYEEISEIIGLGRNTIASKIKRIKEKLIKNSKNL